MKNKLIKFLLDEIELAHNHIKISNIQILRNLICLMDEKHVEQVFENYLLAEENFDSGFHNFHKSMRQTDFYNIGEGHIDMIFWEFIYTSETTYVMLRQFVEQLKNKEHDTFR